MENLDTIKAHFTHGFQSLSKAVRVLFFIVVCLLVGTVIYSLGFEAGASIVSTTTE